MYNRYIRNDNGSYTRVLEEEPPIGAPGGASRPEGPPPGGPPPGGAPAGGPSSGGPRPGGPSPGGHAQGGPGRTPPPPGGRPADGLTGVLQHLLDQFHLDHVDTGDLLLLALLFLLFRENADEELLVALGLLLIL